MDQNDINRFEKKFIKNTSNNCWIWTAATNQFGHGMFSLYKGKTTGAHRISYELYKGSIPEGMFVCHSCDNPKCVNPEHLWIGTHQDNMADMAKKGRAKGNPGHRPSWTVPPPWMIRKKKIQTPFGIFDSKKEAAEHAGVSPPAISSRMKYNPTKYYYI